jgi:hypothetical protein
LIPDVDRSERRPFTPQHSIDTRIVQPGLLQRGLAKLELVLERHNLSARRTAQPKKMSNLQ